MSDNQTVKPNALVVMVNDSPLSISKALDKISSRTKMEKPVQTATGLNFVFLATNNFSRSSIEANHPEKLKIGSDIYYQYPISFLPIASKKKIYYLIYCRFSAALKEFIIKNLERELQQLSEAFTFLEVDLLGVKNALENGNNLKGNLKATASRIDYFGDNGLEKIVLRGEDVFLSEKYNAIWNVLSGGVTESLALHSIVLQFDTNPRNIKTTLDKFGNFRAAIDESGADSVNFSDLIKFLAKYSHEKRTCPLRRITRDDDDE